MLCLRPNVQGKCTHSTGGAQRGGDAALRGRRSWQHQQWRRPVWRPLACHRPARNLTAGTLPPMCILVLHNSAQPFICTAYNRSCGSECAHDSSRRATTENHCMHNQRHIDSLHVGTDGRQGTGSPAHYWSGNRDRLTCESQVGHILREVNSACKVTDPAAGGVGALA
jgi:hypothetical protein